MSVITEKPRHSSGAPRPELSFHGVRYQTSNVARSVAFYVENLAFKVEYEHLPDFATVSLGSLNILLSGPGASGSRPMPDGERQQPGGWNRVVLRVKDIGAMIDVLDKAGLQFRNALEIGPGGKQIQLETPMGTRSNCLNPAV